MSLEKDCKDIQQVTQVLEASLREYLIHDEVPYLKRWAFEAGHQQCELLGIKPNDYRYKYMQIVSRHEIFKKIHNDVFTYLANNPGEYDYIEITLPKFTDISKTIKRVNKKHK